MEGGILLRFRLDIQHFWPKMQKILAWLCHVCILIAVKGDSGGLNHTCEGNASVVQTDSVRVRFIFHKIRFPQIITIKLLFTCLTSRELQLTAFV